jgi:hypothetical protein
LKAKTVLAAKRFSVFFYKVRTNSDPTKPYNNSLINLVCSVCTGKYCLRFLSHRPRSFFARSVRKTSGKYFPVQTSQSVNKSLIHNYINIYFLNFGKKLPCVCKIYKHIYNY